MPSLYRLFTTTLFVVKSLLAQTDRIQSLALKTTIWREQDMHKDTTTLLFLLYSVEIFSTWNPDLQNFLCWTRISLETPSLPALSLAFTAFPVNAWPGTEWYNVGRLETQIQKKTIRKITNILSAWHLSLILGTAYLLLWGKCFSSNSNYAAWVGPIMPLAISISISQAKPNSFS